MLNSKNISPLNLAVKKKLLKDKLLCKGNDAVLYNVKHIFNIGNKNGIDVPDKNPDLNVGSKYLYMKQIRN